MPDTSVISAIILAAGDSKRMGRTKALLEYEGKFFIENIFRRLRSNKISDRIIVLGANEKEVLSNWIPSGEKPVLNKNPEGGQISSLRAGLKNVNCESEAILIALVDQPTIKTQTYKTIIDFWFKNRDCIIIPKVKRPENMKQYSSSEFKRGHPIIIPKIYWHLCFEGPDDKGLHWVTHHPKVKVLDLFVGDDNILKDFDTPKDYKSI
jgi:molybdenum cofactor cytidylyltransferase